VVAISKRLIDLEHNDFEAGELAAFRNIMSVDSKLLQASLGGAFVLKPTTIEFLVKPQEVPISSTNDEWDYALQARVETLAMSACLVPRLPWEVMLFGEKAALPGVPSATRLSDALIAPIGNVRVAAIKLLENVPDITFAQMRAILKEHEDSLLEMRRFFSLSLYFLKNLAEPLAQEFLTAEMLAALPSATNFDTFTFVKSIGALTALKCKPYVAACGIGCIRKIVIIITLVENIQGGQSPTTKAASQMDDTTKAILGRVEHFCVTTSAGDASKDKTPLMFGRRVSGKDAIALKWRDLQQKDQSLLTLDDVEDFRRYQWLLSDAQLQLVNTVIAKGVRDYQSSLYGGMSVLCDTPVETSTAIVPLAASAIVLSGASSSSSSWSGKRTPSLKASKIAVSMADQKSHLLALFKK
jgi:hypothetical protein